MRVTVNGAELKWHALETSNYNLNLYHFAWALSKPTSNVLFWVETTVDAPHEMPGVRLAIGSNAASRWWLNGEPLIALNDDRQSVIDDGVSRRITLRKGRKVIRAVILNGGGATDFCARSLDENDQPIPAPQRVAAMTRLQSLAIASSGVMWRPPRSQHSPARHSRSSRAGTSSGHPAGEELKASAPVSPLRRRRTAASTA